MPEKMPLVSVVVNACNEAEYIWDCLTSLQEQSRVPDEIIVVDNGSTDKTPHIARSKGARVIPAPGVSRGLARDKGWRQAKGHYILYLDADMVVSKKWVEALCSALAKSPAAIDRIKVYRPNDNFYTQCADAFYDFRAHDYKPFSAWAFRRETLEKIDGFSDSWIEEIELSKRLLKKGMRIVYAPQAIRYHRGPPRKFSDLLRRSIVSGAREYADVFSKHPESYPKVRMFAFSLYVFANAFLLAGGFSNPLLWGIMLAGVPVLYAFLWLKLALFQGGLGRIPFACLFGITFSSLLRAWLWPLGILLGMAGWRPGASNPKAPRRGN